MTESTIKAARTALADTFVFYFKAQSYHWNVEGMFFSQLHGFFGELYEEVYSAIDPLAEEIRTLGVYAPTSLNEIYNNKTIDDDSEVRSGREMLEDLRVCNEQVLKTLNILFENLTADKKQGFADFVAGRIDVHEKHGWQLNSFLK